jgi:hypothetical protein
MKYLRAKLYKAVTFIYRGISTMVLEAFGTHGAANTKRSPVFGGPNLTACITNFVNTACSSQS